MEKVNNDRMYLRVEYSRETDELFSDNIPKYADWLETKLASLLQSPVMRSLLAENVDSVIRILNMHSYSQEEMDEIGDDMTKINDAFAYDHAVCIMLLGGKLH